MDLKVVARGCLLRASSVAYRRMAMASSERSNYPVTELISNWRWKWAQEAKISLKSSSEICQNLSSSFMSTHRRLIFTDLHHTREKKTAEKVKKKTREKKQTRNIFHFCCDLQKREKSNFNSYEGKYFVKQKKSCENLFHVGGRWQKSLAHTPDGREPFKYFHRKEIPLMNQSIMSSSFTFQGVASHFNATFSYHFSFTK